jgi:hypothetical protein
MQQSKASNFIVLRSITQIVKYYLRYYSHMEFNPVFKRRLVRRKGFVTVSIPPQLAKLFGECQDVTIRANNSSCGLIIEPIED